MNWEIVLYQGDLRFVWNGGRTLHLFLGDEEIEVKEVHHYDTITESELTIDQAITELHEYSLMVTNEIAGGAKLHQLLTEH